MNDADFIDSLKSGIVDTFNDAPKRIRAAILIHNHWMKAINLTKDQYQILTNWLGEYRARSSTAFACHPLPYVSSEPYKWFLTANYTPTNFVADKPYIAVKPGVLGKLQSMQPVLPMNYKQNLKVFLSFIGHLLFMLAVFARDLFLSIGGLCLHGVLFVMSKKFIWSKQVQSNQQAQVQPRRQYPELVFMHNVPEEKKNVEQNVGQNVEQNVGQIRYASRPAQHIDFEEKFNVEEDEPTVDDILTDLTLEEKFPSLDEILQKINDS